MAINSATGARVGELLSACRHFSNSRRPAALGRCLPDLRDLNSELGLAPPVSRRVFLVLRVEQGSLLTHLTRFAIEGLCALSVRGVALGDLKAEATDFLDVALLAFCGCRFLDASLALEFLKLPANLVRCLPTRGGGAAKRSR